MNLNFSIILKSIPKRLQNFLSLSKYSNKPIKVSVNIGDSEKIARSIYSPMNVNKHQNAILPNAFKPPAGTDEISVNRLDYATPDFFRNLGIMFQNAERSFFGFAVLIASDVQEAKSTIVSSPINNQKEKNNPFHADIHIGYIVEKGVPLPAEIQWKVAKLRDKSKLYIDPNPKSENWEGGDIS